MGISRRDTIIIAVFVNVALLVTLFATASKIEEERALSQATAILDEVNQVEMPQIAQVEQIKPKLPVDEIDVVLQEYASKQKQVVQLDEQNTFEEGDEESNIAVLASKNVDSDLVAKGPIPKNQEQDTSYVEVKVKKGDVLSKIAKAYNTSVEDIMQCNQLSSTKLRIGQDLKIPVPKITAKSVHVKENAEVKKTPSKKVDAEQVTQIQQDSPEYYVIKSGDNPWKIARKYNMKFEDLLKLNNLDEEKARNLKIGQRIRIQ
jgi:peptidoglycan DL-endopeptidase LytF